MAANPRDDFVFKVAHYGDHHEHFNAICGSPSLEIDAVRDEFKAKVLDARRSFCWKSNFFDVLLAAIDALPPLVEESETSEKSASDKEEENGAGEEEGEKSSKRDRDEAELAAVHRRIPRSMPSEKSPHPRAVHERRFVVLAAEWHPWVTVPERIGGAATTREILADAVALPQKNCVWKNCKCSGATYSERWAHIRAAHWSKTLAAAVAYYPEETSEILRLDMVRAWPGRRGAHTEDSTAGLPLD